MKKKLLLLIPLLCLSAITFSQICGTPSKSNYLKSSSIKSQYLDNSNKICINVKYHIVRQTNGTGGFNSTLLSNVTTTLNTDYNDLNISINSLGYDYINNSTYYNISDTGNNTTEFDGLVQINNDPNAINIYIVNSAASYNGKANGILSKELVIDISFAETSVVSHEMGHCLNLYHTFHGSNYEPPNADDPIACAENINGSNCLTCGDYVCDTPADANTGAAGDYSPAFDNIMSYYYPFDNLTTGQNTRMREAFANSLVLQSIISDSCLFLSETDQVCSDANTLINLNNIQNYPVTWQVSSNVNKISSNNQSITIRSKYATSPGSGWVKATANGIEHTEVFGVNKTEDEINMSVTVSLVNNYLTITIHDGSGNTPYDLYFNNAYKLSTNSRTITFPYYQNSGRVEIRNQNSCETGLNYAYYTGYFGGSYNYSYNVFPNPTSESLTIEKKESTLENLSNSNFDIDKNSQYELYDFYQNLVSKGDISNLTNLDVSKFKEGLYILLIITNENYESHQIIIK